jgi:hypothetical protein
MTTTIELDIIRRESVSRLGISHGHIPLSGVSGSDMASRRLVLMDLDRHPSDRRTVDDIFP